MKKNKLFFFYLIILSLFTIYVLSDTFLISKVYTNVQSTQNNNESNNILEVTNKKVTDNSYKDDNIKINITTYREYDTNIYVADITLSDSLLLKCAFANNSYGKNITNKTSNIASSNNAILAINGDYYGVQEVGYVLKNGVIYRSTPKNNQEDLVIYKDGTFEIINESEVSIEELLNKGAYNILSFGPSLLINNTITVNENTEVGKSMASNPRTAIGYISNNHYVFIVSDGRTSESEGLSLYELATFAKKLGINTLYNLDGGGSSTMYFNGNIINNPTTNGRNISERSVSDIVYIGY